MNVLLREVDKSNWLACTQLKVSEQQRKIFPVPVVYWIAESKVDSSFSGYARVTMQALIQYLKEKHQCKKLILGYRPQNRAAETLYTSLGFEKIDETETEVVRSLLFS